MAEREWHDVGPAGDAPEGHLRRVEAGGRAVCVGRLGERALLVRARVVECDPGVAETADTHRAPAGLDAPEATLRRVAGRTDVVPLPFRHYCAGR